MNVLSLLAIAIAPGVAIGLFIYLHDKHEREPIGLLVKAFMLGCVSIFVTLLISYPIGLLIPIDEQNVSEQAVHAFLVVALVEEFSKFIFVYLIFYRDKNFNEPFDGIVYAVMVGMGFATFENIIYVVQGGIATGIMRMFTAVPAHATFAVLMGYYMGIAKFEQNKKHYVIYGLLAAALLHGAYDYFLFISYVPGIWFGAVVSLLVGVMLSKRAIRLHQQASPFINKGIESEKKEESL